MNFDAVKDLEGGLGLRQRFQRHL